MAAAHKLEVGTLFIPYDIFDGDFLSVIDYLVEREIITWTEREMLRILNKFAFKDGKCYPSQKRLEQEIGLGNSQVRNILRKLEKNGFIRIVRPTPAQRHLFRKRNQYFFLWHVAYLCVTASQSDTEINTQSDTDTPYIENQEIRKSVKKPVPSPETVSETPEPAIPLRGSVFKSKPVLKPLKALCDKINNANRGKNRKRFNPEQAVNHALKSKKHPEAIREALESVLKCWPVIRSPWGYFNQVLAVRSGNYHERQHRRATEALKTELIHAPANIRALVAGIGGDYGPSRA